MPLFQCLEARDDLTDAAVQEAAASDAATADMADANAG